MIKCLCVGLGGAAGAMLRYLIGLVPVGASNGFIRGPFLMEGALHALIGSLLAVGVLQVLRMYGIPKLQSALSFLSLDVSGNTYIMIYIVLVVAGPVSYTHLTLPTT